MHRAGDCKYLCCTASFFPINVQECPINIFITMLVIDLSLEKEANKILKQCLNNGNSANMQSVTALECRVWPFLWCCSMVYH